LIWIGGGVILLNLAESAERGVGPAGIRPGFSLEQGAGFLGGMLTDLAGYHPTLWIISVTQAGSVAAVAPFYLQSLLVNL
jgi:hypothetical protein